MEDRTGQESDAVDGGASEDDTQISLSAIKKGGRRQFWEWIE